MKESEQTQGELFNEFAEPHRRLRRQRGIPYQHRFSGEKTKSIFRSVLNVFPESFLFLAIIFMMVAIVVFIVGVERGKKLAALTSKVKIDQRYAPLPYSEPKKEKILLASVKEKEAETVLKKSAPAKSYAVSETEKKDNSSPSIKEEKKVSKEQKNSDRTKPYTIQVATFRESTLAQKEVRRLEKKGYSAFIIPSGKFYQVCAGTYSAKDNAANYLKSLKKSYKDCFLRKK